MPREEAFAPWRMAGTELTRTWARTNSTSARIGPYVSRSSVASG